MNCSSAEKNRFRLLIGETPKLNVQQVDLTSEAEDSIICHWAYWPTLVFFEMNARDLDLAQLAKRLEISTEEANQIVEDLMARRFLVRREDGKVQRNSERIDSGDDIFNVAARSMHRKSLAIAQRAIDVIPNSEREFQTLTVSGNREVVEKVKEEIRAFTDRIAFLMDQGSAKNEIYRFSIQLFPVNFGDFR